LLGIGPAERREQYGEVRTDRSRFNNVAAYQRRELESCAQKREKISGSYQNPRHGQRAKGT